MQYLFGLFFQFFQSHSCSILLGALLAGAGAFANHLVVQQHLSGEDLIMGRAGLAHQPVAQCLILLLLHQFLQGGLIVRILQLGGRHIA